MSILRRTVADGGLTLLASTTVSATAEATDGVIGDLVKGTEEFALNVEALRRGISTEAIRG